MDSLCYGIENGQVQVRRATLAGSYSTDNVCSIRDGLLRVKRSFSSCKTLDYKSGILIDQYAHGLVLSHSRGQPHRLFRAIAHIVRYREIEARFG